MLKNEETDVTHEEKLGSIIQSNHYIRHRVQESVNEFLNLRQNLLRQLQTKELNNISKDFAPLIDAMQVETLNRKVTSDRVQLALCGENSSGKTSFIHLLLGIRDILPADIGPITARIVKMTYAKPEEACAIIYPSLEASFNRIIDQQINLAPFFIRNDGKDEPDWEGISKTLDEHVRRPKGLDVKSEEFAIWAKHFIEIRLPSSTLKLGIDVYDTAGFRRRDAQILKDCLYDLVRLIHPTIVFLYDNPSSTDETNDCFVELKNTLRHLDSTNIFFLNTKADIDKMPGIKKVKTEKQFVDFIHNEQIKRYGLLLKAPGMANGMIGGLPKSFDKCHCFDMCSVYSQRVIPYGPTMNKTTVQRLIQFVANSDLIMAQRVCNLVLPAIEAFFDLNLITSHREKDQIKQLRIDALQWIDSYFDKHHAAFDRFLRDIFKNIITRLSANEASLADRAAKQIESTNIKIFIQLCIQQEIMKGVIYDALGLLPSFVSDLMNSNQNLTINASSNEILVAGLRVDIDDRSEILDEESVNTSTLKCFMKQTFITPALMVTDLLFNEETNATKNNLLSSNKSRYSDHSNFDSSSSINPLQEAQQYLKELHHHIKTSEKMFSTTISTWCSRLKDKLKQQITQHYDAAVIVLPVRHRVHGILQQYIHQFVRIECQLQAAQDFAKFNGKKPLIRSSTKLNSDSPTTVYSFDEIEWGSINKNLFVKRLTHPIPSQPYTSYLEAHYHRKLTNLNIPNIIKLTYLYENRLRDGSYEIWMIFDMRTLNIKRNLKDFIDKHHQLEIFIPLKKHFEIILPIINALAGLHENELAHRNVQLTNILLDENDQSFLADLGNWDLSSNDKSNEIEMRHYISQTSDGRINDIKAFAQLTFFLSTITDPKDLSSPNYQEYKQIMDTCVTAVSKTIEIRHDLKYLYDRLCGFSK
jgi:hypothetical protein